MAGEKMIGAGDVKPGTCISYEGKSYFIKKLDRSKPGKHGPAKCRIEAEAIMDGKKIVIAVPGHERFEVPFINKRKAQVLNINKEKANVMDLENFETLEIAISEDVKENIKEGSQVEYWELGLEKIIKRVL